jgi:hypothetical protein
MIAASLRVSVGLALPESSGMSVIIVLEVASCQIVSARAFSLPRSAQRSKEAA